MHPNFLDNMSWEMAEVYGAITDQILINLARHFPFYVAGEDLPKSAFAYQAQMLAQMGQINAETVRIIRNGLADADPALVNCLEQSIIDSVKATEPDLAKAARRGILNMPVSIPIAPNQYRAFNLYYKQAADKLNLVNTVMLESTQSAYRQAVADVVSEISVEDMLNRTQIAIDTAAGETLTGVSSWNQALRHACDKLNNGGIVGFIDHAGHRWSAEAYVAMDIRTTVYNTGRAAVWETNEDFGNDLYSVSYHNGARPLCYPWQNKVISRLDAARTVVDLDGNAIEVIAQSATSYGAPAGLFGINCKHYPTPFIPGVSVLTGQPQDEETNKQVYAESQEQRRLERKLREEKRDYLTAKAQGRPQEELDALQQKCRNTSGDIDEFCKKTGRARHRDREGVYTKREFPDSQKYNVADFENKQKDLINSFYKSGGAQQNFTAGQMIPNEPLVPNNVASQATQTAQPVLKSTQEVFTPAKTRAEAEQYAREHFATEVKYNGKISVDGMNAVNEELKRLTDDYPIDKLRSITQNGRITAIARANGRILEINGGKIGEQSPYTFADRQASVRRKLDYYAKTYPDGVPSYLKKDVAKLEETLKYSRWTIDDEMTGLQAAKATIDHEYGHILADQRCGQINPRLCKTYYEPETVAKRKLISDTFRKAKDTGDIYKLSEYGGTNEHEFFAETFSAYMNGEEVPDYFIDMILGVV